MSTINRLAAISLAALALTGCATGPNANPADPLEPFNRGVSTFNDKLDTYALKPVATVYSDYMPTPVQLAVGNFFSNVSDVYSAANNLLQGKPSRAAEDTMRVAINSVLGIGGLIDIATPAGLPKYKEDFGQTMGVWGVPAGPYLVLPLFGPSSVRDTTGMVVDRFMDPTSYISPWYAGLGVQGVRVIDGRAQLLGATSLIEAAALDRYSFLRDSYLQRREYLIHEGNPPKKGEDEEQDDKGAPAQPPSQSQPVQPSAPAQPSPAPAEPATPAAPADSKAG